MYYPSQEKIPWSGSVAVYMDALLNISSLLFQSSPEGRNPNTVSGNFPVLEMIFKLSYRRVWSFCIKRSFPSIQSYRIPDACFPKLVEPFP